MFLRYFPCVQMCCVWSSCYGDSCPQSNHSDPFMSSRLGLPLDWLLFHDGKMSPTPEAATAHLCPQLL